VERDSTNRPPSSNPCGLNEDPTSPGVPEAAEGEPSAPRRRVAPTGVPTQKRVQKTVRPTPAEEDRPWWLVQVFPPLDGNGFPSRMLPVQAELEVGRDASHGKVYVVDGAMSRTHFRLVRSGDALRVDDINSTNGTWVNRVRVGSQFLRDQDVVRAGDSLFLVVREAPSITPEWLRVGSVACSSQMVSAMQRLRMVAPSRRCVLFVGDVGCGKERMAAAMHALSGRKGPFGAFDCSGIPTGHAQRLLFGSASGPSSEGIGGIGRVEQAAGGTLLLKNIDHLPEMEQALLVEFLRTGEFQRAGDWVVRKGDVRVAGTMNPVRAAVRSEPGLIPGLRRVLEEAVFRIQPLRQRRADIMPLIYQAMRRQGKNPAEVLGADLLEQMLVAAWQHDARQLVRSVERLLAGTREGGGVDVDEVAAWDRRDDADILAGTTTVPVAPAPRRLMDLLELHGGSATAVAQHLKTNRRQVYRWMERYGMTLPKNRPKARGKPQG